MLKRKICIALSLIMGLCSLGITGCGKSQKKEMAKVYENQIALPTEVLNVAAFTTDKNNIYILVKTTMLYRKVQKLRNYLNFSLMLPTMNGHYQRLTTMAKLNIYWGLLIRRIKLNCSIAKLI